MRYILFLITFIFLGCNKEKLFDGPNFFADDFESYSNFNELLPENDDLWSFTQLTRDQNSISLDTLKSKNGKKALKFIAEKSDRAASKASIAKQKLAFWEGETVRMQANYFIEGDADLEWLFLMDIEEQTAIGAGPGMRLALVDNQLVVEHKFNEKNIFQPQESAIKFPRDTWVEVIWELKLSKKNKGSIKIWQNGILILDTKNNVTLPTDMLYHTQGTKGMYSSFEVGITANSRENPLTLWIDDVKIEKVN